MDGQRKQLYLFVYGKLGVISLWLHGLCSQVSSRNQKQCCCLGAVDQAASGRLLSYAQDRVLDASGVLQICKPCLQCQTPTARRWHHPSM